MSSTKRPIFLPTSHLTRDELVRYHHHLLSPEDQHDVESHLVDCELCSEALKGIEAMENTSLLYTIDRELHRARKKKFARRKIFSNNELVAIFAIVFLILFLLLVAYLFFLKKN